MQCTHTCLADGWLVFSACKSTTIVSWMMLGVYRTQEFLFKMKKSKSPSCVGCETKSENENLSHLLLYCTYYQSIREEFIPMYHLNNKNLSSILDNEEKIILSILDPLSSKLPEVITLNWTSPKHAYEISRQFCYNLHNKREKLYAKINK